MSTTQFAPQLRPLSVGEVLDASFKVVRQSFGTLAACVLVVALPLNIVNTLIQASTSDNAFNLDSATTTDDVGTGTELAGVLLTTALSLVLTTIAAAACFRAVSSVYLGEKPTVGGSLAFAASRVLPVIVLSIVYFIGLIPAFIALIIPGIWLAVAWSVSYPALLSEGLGPIAALGRSFRLVRGRWWPTFGALLVMYLHRDRDQRHPRPAVRCDAVASLDNEVVAAVFTTIVNTLSSLITLPLFAAVLTIIYFDLRVRKEGFDLQLLARGVGSDAPTSPGGVGAASGLGGGGAAGRRVRRRRRRRRRGPPRPASAPPALGRRAAERRSARRRRRRRSAARATEEQRAEPAAAAARRGGARRGAAGLRCRPRSRSPRASPMRRRLARRRAEILQERRFRGSDVPRPFAGFVRWLGDRLQPVARLLRPPGGARSPAASPCCSRSSAGSCCSRRRCSRAGRSAAARPPRCAPPAPARPSARTRPSLERDADRAAAAGEWETAVRLRFRAGLLRLDARELIEYRAVADHRRGRGAVASPGVRARRRGLRRDRLRRRGPPHEADEAASREGWRRVLSEAGRAVSRLRLPRAAPRARASPCSRCSSRSTSSAALVDALAPSPSGPPSSSFATSRRGSRRGRSSRGATASGCARCATRPAERLARGAETVAVMDAGQLTRRRGAGAARVRRARRARDRGWRAARLDRARCSAATSCRSGTTTGPRPRGAAAPRRRPPASRACGPPATGAGRAPGAPSARSRATRARSCSSARSVAGRVALLADTSPLQNRLLGEADNAALALALERPRRR